MLFSSCFLFQLCSLFFFFKGLYIWGVGDTYRDRDRGTETEKDSERETQGETQRIAICGVGVKIPELAS